MYNNENENNNVYQQSNEFASNGGNAFAAPNPAAKTKKTGRLIFFVICGILFFLGVILAVIGYAGGGLLHSVVVTDGGVKVLSAEENRKVVKIDETYENFKNIVVDISVADRVTIKEGDTYSVKGQSRVLNGKLIAKLEGETIHVCNEERNGINWGISDLSDLFIDYSDDGYNDNEYLEITYPKGANIGDVKINTYVTGDLTVENLVCDSLTVDVSVSEAEFNNIETERLNVKSSVGDIEIHGILHGRSDIEMGTGDLELYLDQEETDMSYNIENGVGELEIGAVEFGPGKHTKKYNTKNMLEINSSVGDIKMEFRVV
jgi:hypothetical protein